MTSPQPSRDIAILVEIVRRLRDRQTGCPWHQAQTFETIAPYTIEEAYEVAGAIEDQDWLALKEELGDLLFQVVYHSAMAGERGLFDLGDVVLAASEKMIRRRQDIFADGVPGPVGLWEKAKAEERATKGQSGVLDDVARALPALSRADKLQKRLSSVGFDWNSADRVLDKVAEEAAEIVAAHKSGASHAEVEGEIGDLLFVIANLSRHLSVDPEAALRATNAKVTRRWIWIERQLAAANKNPNDVPLDELEALWTRAKTEAKEP
ncbi:MAG: nucleoside triphosphate pyrophosphohydrolase [Alphaproteobacteria bacterium]|nr:nucleoside triphosphate pyrophosphohydrolase [Alphaproteobacteria bacterium]MBL6936402.1 nucleoside triphosphate pyrophosphohydrolase [Alphaproteobacteria bacterium]MBL7098547.1 nucleoside triphosphate pyrophosphohydrolase [Alphaproteobacteria bacterium]